MKFVIEHLSKHFEAKRVLQDIDFTFESGKIYGLLGRNGAGKTTLFNCLNRDIRTDGGQFYLETEEGRREVRPEDIGYVLSTPTVPEFLTGREFLKFFLEINEKYIEDLQPIDTYFDYVSIAPEDRDKLMKDYSHGMKNKMQMLVNIIAQPKILLLDEPSMGLAPIIVNQIYDLIRQIRDSGITVLLVEQNARKALGICDYAYVLENGKINLSGAGDELLRSDAVRKAYLGG